MLAFGLRGADMMAPVIDVLVKPVITFQELKREAVMVPVGPLTVPIASIEHLIAMKTGTGRGNDAIDIEELRKIQALLAVPPAAPTFEIAGHTEPGKTP